MYLALLVGVLQIPPLSNSTWSTGGTGLKLPVWSFISLSVWITGGMLKPLQCGQTPLNSRNFTKQWLKKTAMFLLEICDALHFWDVFIVIILTQVRENSTAIVVLSGVRQRCFFSWCSFLILLTSSVSVGLSRHFPHPSVFSLAFRQHLVRLGAEFPVGGAKIATEELGQRHPGHFWLCFLF